MENENAFKEKVLNPFSLPPETNARFNLLIVTAAVLSITLGFNIPKYFLSEEQISAISFPKIQFLQTINTASAEEISALREEVLEKVLDYIPSILIIVLILLFTLILTIWFYRKHPSRIIIKQRLQAIDFSNEPRFINLKQEIKNLSGISGISIPKVFISPSFTGGGQAFGFKFRNMLRVDNGLRMMMAKDKNQFRAIVLHEMGHVVNKDVSKMYIAQSLWRSVVLLFAIPSVLIILFTFLSGIFEKIKGGITLGEIKNIFLINLPTTLILFFSIMFIFLILNLMLRGLVKIREYYADWRAASYGAGENLLNLFVKNLKNEKPSIFLKRLFSWHPPLKQRINLLEDPSKLFHVKYDLPFFVGVLIPFSIFSFFTFVPVGMFIVNIFWWISLTIFKYTQNITFTYLALMLNIFLLLLFCFLGIILSAYLVSSTLGLQIQKRILASLSINKIISIRFKELIICSVLVTAGVIIGSMLIPYYSFAFQLNKTGDLIFAWISAFAANFLWLYYVTFFTKYIYGRYTGKESPYLRYFLFNIVGAFLLAILYLPVAGIFFQIISDDIIELNTAVKSLLIIVPLFYLFTFGLTGLVLGVYNSFSFKCKNCNKELPSGNLLSQKCPGCNSVITGWLYIKTKN